MAKLIWAHLAGCVVVTARGQCGVAGLPAGALRQDVEEDGEVCLSALQVGKAASRTRSQPQKADDEAEFPELLEHWLRADVDGDARLSLAELKLYERASSASKRQLPNATVRVISDHLAAANGSLGFLEAADMVAEGDAAEPSHSLDKTVMTKPKDPRCEGAGEGQLCVSQDSLIYCSIGRRLTRTDVQCSRRQGTYSHCVEGGTGLTRNYCDDPFCRNGGAYNGRGTYCKGNTVVYCGSTGPQAPDTPRVVETCSDRVYENNGCAYTERRQCIGAGGAASCQYGGTTSDCSGGNNFSPGVPNPGGGTFNPNFPNPGGGTFNPNFPNPGGNPPFPLV